MTFDSASVPAETLLQHQEFVRKLARSLVRDDDAAGDVVQETWLAALLHAPRSVDSLQGWLATIVRNRAHNRRREEMRRVAREHSSSRSEVDASDELLRDRVALAQDVVKAVLALREPYRAIVLMRYYQNASPRQIAARRGVPSSTVRAQLSRAHQMLRGALDAQRGGDRAAWSAALAALSHHSPSAMTLKLGLIAASCATLIVVPIWLLRSQILPAIGTVTVAGEFGAPAGTADEADLPVDNEPLRANARELVAQQSKPAQETIDPELAAKSVRELLEMAVQTQRTIKTKLLTPDERFVREQANLLRMPSTGLARILERNKFGTDESNALGIRGGGCCFSFATRGQSWDDEPDLSLERGALHPQGWLPAMLDLGTLHLEDLPDAAAPLPSGLDDKQRSACQLMWTDAHATENGVDPEFERSRRSIPPPPTPTVGRTYLLRALDPRVHDLLVGFALLQQDETGCTIAWRVLRVWPVPSRGGGRIDAYWWVADAPASISSQNLETLIALLARIRVAAHAKLFESAEDMRKQFNAILAQPNTGVARLLQGNRYDALLDGRGGGAYFSFASGTNDYDREPDLEFELSGYHSGFYGGARGFVLDIGSTPIEAVTEPFDVPRRDLPSRDQDRWRFIAGVPSPEKGEREHALSRADETRSSVLGFESVVPAKLGHSYLVRCILPNEHDILAVFTTAAMDEAGVWIVWRVLWNRSLRDESKPR